MIVETSTGHLHTHGKQAEMSTRLRGGKERLIMVSVTKAETERLEIMMKDKDSPNDAVNYFLKLAGL
jgi:hypothetical protein